MLSALMRIPVSSPSNYSTRILFADSRLINQPTTATATATAAAKTKKQTQYFLFNYFNCFIVAKWSSIMAGAVGNWNESKLQPIHGRTQKQNQQQTATKPNQTKPNPKPKPGKLQSALRRNALATTMNGINGARIWDSKWKLNELINVDGVLWEFMESRE